MTTLSDIPPQEPIPGQASGIVQYEPGRINWHRLVDDQYSTDEAGKVKIVHIGTVGGKPAWADGFMLEVAEVPPQLMKLKKYRERAKVDDKPRDFTELVPTITVSDPVVRPLARAKEEKTPVPRGLPSVIYMSDNGHEFTAQTKYIDYFVARYSDAQFVMQKQNTPLVVRSKGKTVGVIMPVKVEDTLLLQFRDFLKIKPVAEPEKPPPPAGVTVADMEAKYSSVELKEMARRAGISPTGTKRELCRALIKSG